jgi:hypothetical protein
MSGERRKKRTEVKESSDNSIGSNRKREKVHFEELPFLDLRTTKETKKLPFCVILRSE